MQLHQEPSYRPLTITFDTREEAETFWDIIQKVQSDLEEPLQKDMCIEISNWFSAHFK